MRSGRMLAEDEPSRLLSEYRQTVGANASLVVDKMRARLFASRSRMSFFACAPTIRNGFTDRIR
jgi:hypothetical protein